MSDVQITQEQVKEAAKVGADLLAPGSTVSVPAGHMPQLLLLRNLLTAVAGGSLAIVPVVQRAPAEDSGQAAPTEKTATRSAAKRPRTKKR